MGIRTIMPWHTKPIEEVFREFDTSEEGLSDAEALKRLRENGYNVLRQKKSRSILQMLWLQLKDPMVLILIAASVLSALLREWTEAGVILLIVAVNAVVSIVQEKKAQSSLDVLKKLIAQKAHVRRQGEASIIPASEIVIGDIVFLEDGAMIPADIRLIDSASLKVQEASLTGESLPVDKDSDDLVLENCPLGDRNNMVYSSTLVTYGRGYGVVVAVGMDTEVGQIARLLDAQDEFETPLRRKLTAVGKTLAIVGLIVCAIIFAIGLLYQRPMLPLLMTAISLAISIIPEGLPATATIVLALGVQRMAKRGAIIRQLPAVETLGGATVICSDKTGTLTQNKMTVTHMAAHDDVMQSKPRLIEDAFQQHENYYEMIRAGALCNNAQFDPDHPGRILGDPTEGALLVLSKKFGENQDDMEDDFPRLFEQPFDSDRKRMTTVHEVDGKIIAYTKGATDELLPLCTKILKHGHEQDLTDGDAAAVVKIADGMAKDALRVLAFARKELTAAPQEEDEDVEFDLTFIGLVGMIDPPRDEARKSIATCYKAGIRTVMITGDHKITALAIARSLGICREQDLALTGGELADMDDAQYDAIVGKIAIYARVTPEQKLKIVQSLKRTGEIVAMTGDGVNDAPALKTADIGCAMGIAGTDVAKDAAAMVITDDNFATIVSALKEGRRVYRNIQKVIQFLLSGNISEIITIFVATLANLEAPLLAIHILWINLATDTLPALALGLDPPEKDIMAQKPLKSGSLFEKSLVTNVVIHGTFIAMSTLAAFLIGLHIDDLPSGQTMAFCTIAFSQLIYSYCMGSSTQSMFSRGFFRNKTLVGAIGVSVSLLMLLMFVPPLKSAFQFIDLTLGEWAICLGLAVIPSLLVELMKLAKRLRAK